MMTEFLGMKMKNPLIVAAGPWNRDGRSLKMNLDSGAGAVITETIVTDAFVDVRPRIAYDGTGFQNIRMYSDIQIEGWERELDTAKQDDGIVIASISAHTPSELVYIAEKMEKFGADAIEISISNPMGESLEVMASDVSIIKEMTSAVVSSVKIPVMVKLSQNVTNMIRVAKAAEEADASAVSAINTVRCILGVDIEEKRPLLPAYGGYSGAPIRPLGLASVAALAQSINLPICGVGGIENAKHVLEYIMLGASAVQIGSSIMLHGRGLVSEIIEDLGQYMKKHEIQNLGAVRGAALCKMKALDDMIAEPLFSAAKVVACEDGCRLCMEACIYGAIVRDGGSVIVDRDRCTGCGLCNFICPIDKLYLSW